MPEVAETPVQERKRFAAVVKQDENYWWRKSSLASLGKLSKLIADVKGKKDPLLKKGGY